MLTLYFKAAENLWSFRIYITYLCSKYFSTLYPDSF